MKANKVSKDVKHGLAIFTEEKHTWVIGAPDKKGLRAVYFDTKKEGRGTLLGSILPKVLGHIHLYQDIEIGWRFGIKFPDRPKSKRVLVSDFVTTIIVMTKEREKVSAVYGHVN